MKLSIIIPVHNESRTLLELLSAVEAFEYPGLEKELLIVDDGSTDGSWELLSQHKPANCFLYHYSKNQGKGAAVRWGIAQSTGDLILIQDADLEYSPKDYPQLIRPILAGEADLVYGSRFKEGVPWSLYSKANQCLTWLSNRFTPFKLSDMETCYKVFRGDLLRSLDLRQRRFGFEPEVTLKLARQSGVRLQEVPISYQRRSHAEGKHVSWRDGIVAIACIFYYGLGFDKSFACRK